MFAAMNGETDIVKLLLEWKADIEAKDQVRCSPSIFSRSCFFFYSLGDRQIPLQFGKTAVMFAADKDETGAVELLLEWKADIETKDQVRCSPSIFSRSCFLFLLPRRSPNSFAVW
jgi:hypothetical protein